MTPVRLEPAALRSRVKHSTTEPLPGCVLIIAHTSIKHVRVCKILDWSWRICPYTYVNTQPGVRVKMKIIKMDFTKYTLTFACWVFFVLLFKSADFFISKLFFLKKKLFQERYQCQTVWIQIWTDIQSVLIWVQNPY